VFTEPHDDDGDEVQCGAKGEWGQARQEVAKSTAGGVIPGSRKF
jgi:hypothetical protein